MVFFIVLDVCLCTHNPRPEILAKVLASIQNQTVGESVFRFLLVDNASSPSLDESLLAGFSQRGISARIVREPMLGIARARLRAILETDGDILLFVDDDNELTSHYIAEGMMFASVHQDVGCFGGKLLLPPDLHPMAWVKPFLPYLAIRDIGEEPVFGKSASWGVWEPPTAGAFVRRPVLDQYVQRANSDERIFKLGRIGKKNLMSCEDSVIMRGAFMIGLSNAYNPRMILHHHLDSKRFDFWYLIRFMYAFGVSQTALEVTINGRQAIPECYSSRMRFLRLLLGAAKGGAQQSLAFGLGLMALRLGERTEHLRKRMGEY
jgi:glycosyltransferase involved in cell wall biosynthesis